MFIVSTVGILRTDPTCFKTMAAERGAVTNADVEVKGLSADGFQQSYSRGRVLKTFRDNGVYVERCIVEQCDVSTSLPARIRDKGPSLHRVDTCRMLALQFMSAFARGTRRMRLHVTEQVRLAALWIL